MKARVQWYYKPDRTSQGRKDYHGTKELFQSDRYDTQSLDCIIGKCTGHSFRDYVKFGNDGDEDFYPGFEYNAAKTEELKLCKKSPGLRFILFSIVLRKRVKS